MDNPIVKSSFREGMLPNIWCPGCGNGIILRDIAQAIVDNGIDNDRVCIVSGIGCSSRATGYMDYNTIHTTHGRAIPVATGIKMANDDLEVIVITGDGDATAIGGNHFIHGARRNFNLTVVVFNNNTYGMTSGQYSPTTPPMAYSTTTPYGNIDNSFDIPKLAIAAGATFVARGSTFHADLTTKLIKRGILHRGFAVIDCICTCPTYYGSKNGKGNAVDMLRWQRDSCVDVARAAKMGPEELADKVVIGELFCEERANYSDEYRSMMSRCKAGVQ